MIGYYNIIMINSASTQVHVNSLRSEAYYMYIHPHPQL